MRKIFSLQELPKLLQDLGTTDADLPWNKSKNRFPNIKPCNQLFQLFLHRCARVLCMFLHLVFSKLCPDNNNRVKLLSEPGSAGSDYINASFISVSICCQRETSQIISNHRYFRVLTPYIHPSVSRAIFAPMSSSPPRVPCQALWLTFGG